jgi:hypothetical protein
MFHCQQSSLDKTSQFSSKFVSFISQYISSQQQEEDSLLSLTIIEIDRSYFNGAESLSLVVIQNTAEDDKKKINRNRDYHS